MFVFSFSFSFYLFIFSVFLGGGGLEIVIMEVPIYQYEDVLGISFRRHFMSQETTIGVFGTTAYLLKIENLLLKIL